MKLALLGNCSYQALVDDNATIKWLCWPRFDSSFVFGSLLDSENGGEFSITPPDEFESFQSYIPHTNIVRTHFKTDRGELEVVDLAPRFLQNQRSFKPSMLIRKVRRLSGAPLVRIRCEPVYDYGETTPKHYTASNHVQWLLDGARLRLTTNAPLAYLTEGRPFLLDRDLYLCLTWGEPLEAPLADTCDRFLALTQAYWERWVKHCVLPQRFQEPVIRSALALKLHQYEDTGAITAAATTSLPEHDGSGRNWDYRYCWLRDSVFTLGALRRLGHFEEMEAFVSYLHGLAATSPGRLQPVYGISGEPKLTERSLDHLAGYRGNRPVRVGNAAYSQVQHDVYGELAAAIAPLHTDVRFRDLDRSTGLLHSLLDRIDQFMQAPDVGIWEKRDEPQVHTFSVLMHWAGANAAARAAIASGDNALAERAEALARTARELIESAWRPELGYFADTLSGDQADASLLMLVNLGFLRPDDSRALSHVRAVGHALRANDWLLWRYKHNDGLGDTLSAFTVCSFWYAEALTRLGCVDEAETVFSSLIDSANHVGLLSEDIDPKTGAQWGNFPQTYSHVGLINTAFAISDVAVPII